MNKFELFTMIYMALDAYYEKGNTPDNINTFLSDMNPFTFTDIGSAVSDVYHNFCNFIGDRKITIDNSYDLAYEYICQLTNVDVRDAFDDKLKEIWIDSCREYLASPHKGEGIT